MRFIYLILLLVFLENVAVGQWVTIPNDSSIQIIEEPGIKNLLTRQLIINSEKKGIPGYRVQLFSDSGNNAKKDATQVKTDFLTKFPESTAYLIYQEPNFKIRVGDFRTRLEAYRFQQKILIDFPNSFLVKDDVVFEHLH